MHTETGVRGTALAILVVAGAACGPSPDTQRRTDSAVASAAQEKVATQAGEVMAARREAQPNLDGARAAFVAKDRAVASKELRDAAAFTRSHADSAAEPAGGTLLASADELDRLADRVSSGAVGTVVTLDNAFARMHLAEAQFHCTRALAAWKRSDAGATSSELLMLADHFERAASDARQPLAAASREALVNARSIATRLTKAGDVPPAEVEKTLTRMDKEVHAIVVPGVISKH